MHDLDLSRCSLPVNYHQIKYSSEWKLEMHIVSHEEEIRNTRQEQKSQSWKLFWKKKWTQLVNFDNKFCIHTPKVVWCETIDWIHTWTTEKKTEGNRTENWNSYYTKKLNKQWKCKIKFVSFYTFITAEHSE